MEHTRLDFSWVKELAEKANQQEEKRQGDVRQHKVEERQLALATAPFVEKLQLLTQTCADEFNKYVSYPHLKIAVSRIQRRVVGTLNPEHPELSCPDEKASFLFTRQGWTYAIRGSNGVVEFLELPSTGDSSLASTIDELGITPSRKLVADIEGKSQQIVWKYDGQVVDGQGIVALFKDYIKEFIERTNQ